MTQTNSLTAYAATRDAEAFARVVEQYQRLVFATCRRKLHDRADLDDAVQETFLKLAQNAGEPKSHLGGWLHRCAVNVAIDMNRRRDRRRTHESAAAGERPEGEGDPQRMLAELREQIDEAMERLDPDQRELIIQRFFAGRQQVEIAAEAGVSPSTITKRLDAAIERLRSHLRGLGSGGIVAAGGAAVVAGLLDAEHASAAVPAGLTANVMKVGLSGTPKTAATAAGAGATSAMALKAWAAVALLVLGAGIGLTVWAFTGSPSNTFILDPPPPAAPANTALTAAQAGAPPQWQATPPSAAGQPASLAGRILDRAGKPVANATVTLQGPSFARAKTDKDGNYAFPTVRADGEFRIGVQADGFVPIDAYRDNIPSVQLSRQSGARRDVVIDRGVRVTVTAKDAAGKPVAKVRVDAATPDDRHMGSYSTQLSDAKGTLTLTLPPDKRAYVIAGVIKGYAPAHTTVTPSSVDQPLDVTLTMTKGVSVAGVALCKDGKPATGWSIVAYPAWWSTNYLPDGAKVDAEGKFTLTDISPGQYRLHVSIPSGTLLPITTMTLLPGNDQEPIRLSIPLASPGTLARLVGKVKFKGGMPDYVSVQATGSADRQWHQAMVETRRSRGNARLAPDEGQFTLEALPPGEYELRFESPSIETKIIEKFKVPGELPPIEINVVGKPRLTGTVTDPAGKPVTHFAVRVRKVRTLGQGANYAQEARWTQVSNPAGKFDVELVGPGVYQVQASVDGYAWLWSPETTVEKGTADVALHLTPGGSLRGTVVGPDGSPVEGAKVIPMSMAKSVAMGYAERFGGDAGAVTTDARGAFTLPHLAPGVETVKVVHPKFASSVVAKLSVTDGQTSDAGTIKLGVGGTVEGIIYDGQGKPAPGVTLQFQDESGYSGGGDEEAGRVAVASSDDKGFFRVEHLPEQMLWVNAAELWKRSGVVRRAVRPVNGKTARLDFGGTAPVTGRLLQGGKPVATKRIELSVDSPHFGAVMVNGNTDADGRFSFFGPPTGRYTLYASADGQRGEWMRIRDVTVAGQAVDLGDSTVDVGPVVITPDGDTPEDLKPITFVTVTADVKGKPWQEQVAQAGAEPGGAIGWRAADIPAGHFRVSLYAKGEGNSSTEFGFPFDRSAGVATTPVRIHVPRASATLNVTLTNPPSVAGTNVRRSAVLQTEDKQVLIRVGAADKSEGQPVAIKVPPGTYRVIDFFTGLPSPVIDPLVIKEGETKDVVIDLQRVSAANLVPVHVRFWDGNGIPLTGVTAKLIGPDGTTIDPAAAVDTGERFVAAPGHYQLSLDRPGKGTVTREVDVAALNPETGSHLTPVDIFAD